MFSHPLCLECGCFYHPREAAAHDHRPREAKERERYPDREWLTWRAWNAAIDADAERDVALEFPEDADG